MRSGLLLALATLAACACAAEPDASNDTNISGDQTVTLLHLANGTVLLTEQADNDTLSDGEPVVRKKRTFGDIVFRGLADVLGYNVARKAPQAAFPPPLAPVPGIDLPLQAGPAPPPPCGAPRAAGPPPCRPPPPPPPPPCPKPRAIPRPPPPPPPPPPCAKPRAAGPPPCAPPPPKLQANPNVETIQSNLRLSFDFNRVPPTAAAAEQVAEAELPAAAPVAIEPRAARLPAEPPRKPRVFVDAFVVRNGVAQKVDALDAAQFNPRQPAADDDYLAYDDEEEQPAYDDYEDAQESRDRAKAVKEFGSAVGKFWEEKRPSALKKRKRPVKKAPNHYLNVHFGDRELGNQLIRRNDEQLQSLHRERPANRRSQVEARPQVQLDTDEDSEVTTTTEDPRRKLRPRVLPPTEQNPGEIDTVTVRVPPIYKEKRPKKLNRRPIDRPDRDEEDGQGDEREYSENHYDSGDSYSYNNRDDDRHRDRDADRDGDRDSDSEHSSPSQQTDTTKRRRRVKKIRRVTRSADDPYSAGDYDYFGKKRPISKEEEYFQSYRLPEPSEDEELARLEDAEGNKKKKKEHDYYLNDHERLIEDPEREGEEERLDDSGRTDDWGKTDNSGRSDDSGKTDNSGRSDDSGRTHEKERIVQDPELITDDGRADESERDHRDRERSDERERTDRLSPNAFVHETGFSNNYVHASNVQVDDPGHYGAVTRKKKKTKNGNR